MSYLLQKKFFSFCLFILLAVSFDNICAMTTLQQKLGQTKTALTTLQEKLTHLKSSLGKLKNKLSKKSDVGTPELTFQQAKEIAKKKMEELTARRDAIESDFLKNIGITMKDAQGIEERKKSAEELEKSIKTQDDLDKQDLNEIASKFQTRQSNINKLDALKNAINIREREYNKLLDKDPHLPEMLEKKKALDERIENLRPVVNYDPSARTEHQYTINVPERMRREAVAEAAEKVVEKKKTPSGGHVEKPALKQLQEMQDSSIWGKLEAGTRLDRDAKITCFMSDSEESMAQNALIPIREKNDGLFRIATYNINSFSGATGKLKGDVQFPAIVEVIKNIDADVLILQEAEGVAEALKHFDPNKYRFGVIKGLGYEYSESIKTGTWPGFFGNFIFSKYPFVANSALKKFDMQYIRPGQTEPGENRAYINVIIQFQNNKTISIYGTHLDVEDESGVVRKKQIDELVAVAHKDKYDNVLIAADFNEVRRQDYSDKIWDLMVKDRQSQVSENWPNGWPTPTSVADTLKANNFVDCFSYGKFVAPKFTVWSGTVVDFIYLRSNGWNLPVKGSYTYFSSASDHLPVIMDIEVGAAAAKVKSKYKSSEGHVEKSVLFMPAKPIKVATDITFAKVKEPEPPYKPTGGLEPRNQFFQNVTGIDENDFKQRLESKSDFEKSFTISQDAQGLTLKIRSTGTTFQCGTFEQVSIKDLQIACQGEKMPGGGTFNVVEGVEPLDYNYKPRWFYHHVDVGSLQADPTNRDAVFQVASNFNGLETASYSSNIVDELITNYTGDPTQGPAASISAAPGTIMRRYFMFYDVTSQPSKWGQTNIGEHKVNFLDGLFPKKDLDLDNDYPNFNGSYETYVTMAGYPRFSATQKSPGGNDDLKIKIGFHGGVSVTYGVRSGDQHENIITSNPNQIVNQVFTAAIDLGQGTNPSTKIIKEWAQVVLNAAYEGTLRKAFLARKKKVFLTLIGGGAFGNDIKWIFSAIDRMRDFIKDSGLEVMVVCYTLGWNQTIIRPSLASLVHATGGTYKQYRQDGVYSFVSNELGVTKATLG